jgi:hypothetical protein
MVRIRTSGQFTTAYSSAGEVITTVPADKVLVIETISANIRIQQTTPLPDIGRFVVVTGSVFPPGTGSPLIDIPVTRMTTNPIGNFIYYVGLATDGIVQYSMDFTVPSRGFFDVSLFGYLLPADSPSLAP